VQFALSSLAALVLCSYPIQPVFQWRSPASKTQRSPFLCVLTRIVIDRYLFGIRCHKKCFFCGAAVISPMTSIVLYVKLGGNH
jgi:hypothetical protein